MLVILSPSKTLDFSSALNIAKNSGRNELYFREEIRQLLGYLKLLTKDDLQKLMALSPKLAELNYERFKAFSDGFNSEVRQAIFAFKGDVYEGLQVKNFNKADLDFAQQHLRILSGLYGLLKPHDLIQPYRLEMGTKLKTQQGKNLYEFWGNKLTEKINDLAKNNQERFLVNLASNEYFSAINTKLLQPLIITPIFKERKNGVDKVIGLFAKKARGQMAAFIIKNRLSKPDQLQGFCENGYEFDQHKSNSSELVFIRK